MTIIDGTTSWRRRGILALAALLTVLTAGLVVGTPAVAAVPGVSTATPSIAQGKTLTIDFDAQGAAHAKDWVGVYASGLIQARCPSPATYWGYTSSGTQSAGSTAKNAGSVTFDTSSWMPGAYSVYFCQNDGYTTTGVPITVTVTPAPDPTPPPDPDLIWPSLPGGFVSDTLRLPAVPLQSPVTQRLGGLWNGSAPTSYAKVGGDDWLTVDANGVVSGTTPGAVPDNAGEITVSATSGIRTAQILVEVPVAQAPPVRAVSWNAWGDGAHVTDAVGKNLAALATRGAGILGFQDGGADMAKSIAAALGWNVETSGNLGVVSRYPFAATAKADAAPTAPAFGATVDVYGHALRVWDAYIAAGSGAPVAPIADLVRPDVQQADRVPVVVLAGLGVEGDVSALTGTGLTDAYRAANPSGGATWPVFPSASATATRIDVVLEAGAALHAVDADQLRVGWPSATDPAGNSWASDHAAVTAVFTLADAAVTPSPTPSASTPPATPGQSAAPTPGAGTGTGELPWTGADPLPILLVAGILLALGAGAVVAVRLRNRRRTEG
ncbi:endonuclease/exonuclease/phosphatase family protein [Microbacterium azadirachtae]|uniref:Endonuclease/Exonuclease/phosphatase family protein n=1 Tax=Microbacterium azadirachtae TaxID=582680 RepID=A0A1I6G8W6_9MICO|nr:endonuclease/exonuclease/phosphatase family protein [Microbacterium azadirachtae]SDL37730.1 hypothetical protein SAMN04488593_0890 [Microbacterium azadirachtae]SEF68712.1 hypothetical protein SAMN04488594_0880 [Microbacterium azadirachtae]SEF69370.1 hypothetical protein SAMN04488592_0889 [Microbacterium azadirachtae]SFR38571.1 hypothetical protein SAMN04488591_0886 [Microbacterium azadirachtae]